MSVLLLVLAGAITADANSHRVGSDVPFLLSPVGVDYLGWLTPKECTHNHRCDVLVVNPRTGQLYLEQSDDLIGSRIYSERIWGLSHRVEYELEDSLVRTVQDFWDTSIQYQYEGRNLTQVEWSDGRSISIEYDRRDRVIAMTDGEEHRLDFVWGRDGQHRMVQKSGQVVSWVVDTNSVTVTDSLGFTASTLYEDDMVVGWVDPRGMTTRLLQKESGLEVDQFGLRTWKIQQTDKSVTQLELVGSGLWKWQYDAQGRLEQITDPSMNKVTLLRENDRSMRILRHNGFVDFEYSVDGYLTGVSDISGTILTIDRDIYGQIVEIKDAVGESIRFTRDDTGLVHKLRLRDGREWIIEWDSDGYMRNLVLPNQEMWGFNRDAWGHVTGINRSHDKDFSFTVRDGTWSAVTLPTGEKWTIRRDEYDRLTEVKTAVGSMVIQRDVLGQVIGVSLPTEVVSQPNALLQSGPVVEGTDSETIRILESEAEDALLSDNVEVFDATIDATVFENIDEISESPTPTKEWRQSQWLIERDVFGNIRTWQDIELERGAWDAIEKQIMGDEEWRLERDSNGRLISLQAGNEQVDILYDGSGEPVKWTQGEAVSIVKRNHLGWVTHVDDQWLQHDPRGLVEASGVFDLTWRWNRSASGFPMVVKGPYQQQVGFELSTTNGIHRIRFPSGEMQRFRLQSDGLAQWYTNIQGQEQPLPIEPRTEWVSKVLNREPIEENPQLYTNGIGIHTIEEAGGIQTIGYDALHFVRELCDLSSCIRLSYDPRGRLVSLEDGTGLPTNIVWGWSGWSEVPLLIGGTVGFYTPRGMILQSTGEQQKASLFGAQMASSSVEQPFMDAASYVDGVLSWIDNPLNIAGQRVGLKSGPRVLQRERPWMSNTFEAGLYTFANERSIWNDPIQLLLEMSLIEFPGWTNVQKESPLNWLSEPWLSTHQPWATEVNGLPLSEAALEGWMLNRLLSGAPDPSNNEVLFQLLDDPEIESIITGDYPFRSTKCILEFAQFYSCG